MTRLDKLRNVMREKGLDALLITSPFNLRYISNFTGTTGLSLITLDKAYFVTDFRIHNKQLNKRLALKLYRTMVRFMMK